MPFSLEKISLHDLQISFEPKLVEAALRAVQEDRVQEYELENDTKLSGYVIENRKRYLTTLTMVDDKLHMGCECGRLKDGPCLHVVALLMAWTLDREAIEDEDDPDFEESDAPAARPVDPTGPPQIFPPASLQEIRADWTQRLENLTVKAMREIGAAWGVKIKGTLREQVFSALLDLITAPETLSRVLDKLAPDARRVLDLLCCLYRTVPMFNTEQIKPYLQAALANGQKARPVDECLQDLQRVGLYIIPSYEMFFQVPLQVVAMTHTNPALFKPWSGAPAKIEAVPSFAFARLALRLLLLAQGGRLHRAPQTRKHGSEIWPNKSEADKGQKEREIIPEPVYLEGGLRAALAHDLALPPEELDLAARMLDTGGLWQADAAKTVSEKVPAWLQLSLPEQSCRLFALAAMFPTQLELDLARPSGLTAWRATKDSLGYQAFLNLLGLARLRLVRLLARLPQGQWFEIDSILRTVHGLQPGWLPEFISRQGSPYAGRYWENAPLWAMVARARVNPLKYEDWSKAYGQFYRVMLTHSLPWLGLLDVGLENGKPVAVRLSEFGEFLVERRAEFPLPALKSQAAPLTINAAGLLVLDLDAAPPDLIQLVVQIALPENSAKSSGSPRHLTYRLNDSSLGETFEAGWTLEALAARLQAGLHAPLPEALRERLQRIWERYGRLQIYEDMTLIELADDFALPELLAGTRLSQILLYTFSPRLVAVRSAGLENFVSEMQAKGYTPRVEGGERG